MRWFEGYVYTANGPAELRVKGETRNAVYLRLIEEPEAEEYGWFIVSCVRETVVSSTKNEIRVRQL